MTNDRELPGFTEVLSKRRGRYEVILLAHEGSKITPDIALSLERRLVDTPHDEDVRIRLLGFYLTRQFESDVYKQRRSQHILWILENAPASDVCLTPYVRLETDPKSYELGRDMLLKQSVANPTSVVLENAAWFLKSRDWELASDLWQKARKLSKEK